MNIRMKEEQELKQIVMKSGLKKIYVHVTGTGKIDLVVNRANGTIDKYSILTDNPMITNDPDILLAARVRYGLKIADPTAHQMLKHIFEKTEFATVDRNLTSADRAIKIWQYKADLEDLMRHALEENGYTVEKSCEEMSMKRYDLDSMVTYLKNLGYTVLAGVKKHGLMHCPKCLNPMTEYEPYKYFCAQHKEKFGAISTGKKFLTVPLTEEVEKQISEYTKADTPEEAKNIQEPVNPMDDVVEDQEQEEVVPTDIKIDPIEPIESERISFTEPTPEPAKPAVPTSKTRIEIAPRGKANKGTKTIIKPNNKKDNALDQEELAENTISREHDFKTGGDPFNI